MPLDGNAPDPETSERMLTAFDAACDRLQVRNTADTPVWGWRGRTLSRRVLLGSTACWMRLAASPRDRIAETFWHGNLTAEQELPQSLPRPRLLHFAEYIDSEWAYAAEVFEMSSISALSPTPATRRSLLPAGTWWQQLRAALETVAAVPTTRQTITPTSLATIREQILGHDRPAVPAEPWVTAHGDLHWGNLGGPTLTIFDWEGWGLAPAGAADTGACEVDDGSSRPGNPAKEATIEADESWTRRPTIQGTPS